jgi:hypothetical protein
MRNSICWLNRVVGFGLAIMLAMPMAEAAESSHQPILDAALQSAPSVPNQPKDSGARTASMASERSASDSTLPDSPTPTQSQSAAPDGQPAITQPAQAQQQETAPKPVGAAAAPYEKTTGVAASRPAGAVIAPAKQRRARSILIRVSIVAGAAVAIGTVVALSHGSPSRPN